MLELFSQEQNSNREFGNIREFFDKVKLKTKKLKEIVKKPDCLYSKQNQGEKSKYYLCLCQNDKMFLICEYCRNNCHKNHEQYNYFLSIDCYAKCCCGLKKHKVTEKDDIVIQQIDKKLSRSACFYDEFFEKFPNLGFTKIKGDKGDEYRCYMCTFFDCKALSKDYKKKITETKVIENSFDGFAYSKNHRCTCPYHGFSTLITFYKEIMKNINLSKYFFNFNFNITRTPIFYDMLISPLIKSIKRNIKEDEINIEIPYLRKVISTKNTSDSMLAFYTDYYTEKSLEVITIFLFKYMKKYQFLFNPFGMNLGFSKFMTILKYPNPDSLLLGDNRSDTYFKSKFYFYQLIFTFYIRPHIERYNNTFDVYTITNMNLFERFVYIKNAINFYSLTDNFSDLYKNFENFEQYQDFIEEFTDLILNDIDLSLRLYRGGMNETFVERVHIVIYMFTFLIKYNLIANKKMKKYFEFLEEVFQIFYDELLLEDREKRENKNKQDLAQKRALIIKAQAVAQTNIPRQSENDMSEYNHLNDHHEENNQELLNIQINDEESLDDNVSCDSHDHDHDHAHGHSHDHKHKKDKVEEHGHSHNKSEEHIRANYQKISENHGHSHNISQEHEEGHSDIKQDDSKDPKDLSKTSKGHSHDHEDEKNTQEPKKDDKPKKDHVHYNKATRFNFIYDAIKGILYYLTLKNDETFISYLSNSSIVRSLEILKSKDKENKWAFEASYDTNQVSRSFAMILYFRSKGENEYSNIEKQAKFDFCVKKILEILIGNGDFYLKSIAGVIGPYYEYLDSLITKNKELMNKDLSNTEIEIAKPAKVISDINEGNIALDHFSTNVLASNKFSRRKFEEKFGNINDFNDFNTIMAEFYRYNCLFSDLTSNFNTYVNEIETIFKDLFKVRAYTDKGPLYNRFKEYIAFTPMFKRFNEFFEIYNGRVFDRSLNKISDEVLKGLLKFFTRICNDSNPNTLLITSFQPENFYNTFYIEKEENKELFDLLFYVAKYNVKNENYNNSNFTSGIINLVLKKLEADIPHMELRVIYSIFTTFLRLQKILLSCIDLTKSEIFDTIKQFVKVLVSLKTQKNFILGIRLFIKNSDIDQKLLEEFLKQEKKEIATQDQDSFEIDDDSEDQSLKYNDSKIFDDELIFDDDDNEEIISLNGRLETENRIDESNTKFDFIPEEKLVPEKSYKFLISNFLTNYLDFVNKCYKKQLVFFNYYKEEDFLISVDDFINRKNGIESTFKSFDPLLIVEFVKFFYFSKVKIRDMFEISTKDICYTMLHFMTKIDHKRLYAKSNIHLHEYKAIIKHSILFIFNKMVRKYSQETWKLEKVKLLIRSFEETVLIPLYFLNNLYMFSRDMLTGQEFFDLYQINYSFAELTLAIYEKKMLNKFDISTYLCKDLPKENLNILKQHVTDFHAKNLTYLMNDRILNVFREVAFIILKPSLRSRNIFDMKNFIASKGKVFENTYVTNRDNSHVQNLAASLEKLEYDVFTTMKSNQNFVIFAQTYNKYIRDLASCYKKSFSLMSIFDYSQTESEMTYQRCIFKYIIKKVKGEFDMEPDENSNNGDKNIKLDNLALLTFFRNILYHGDNFDLTKVMKKEYEEFILMLSRGIFLPCFTAELYTFFEFDLPLKIKTYRLNSFTETICTNAILILRDFCRDEGIYTKIFNIDISDGFDLSPMYITKLFNPNVFGLADTFRHKKGKPLHNLQHSSTLENADNDEPTISQLMTFINLHFLYLRIIIKTINYDEKENFIYSGCKFNDKTRLEGLYIRILELINEVINNQQEGDPNSPDQDAFLKKTNYNDKKYKQYQIFQYFNDMKYLCSQTNFYEQINNGLKYKFFTLINALLVKKKLSMKFLNYLVSIFDCDFLVGFSCAYVKMLIQRYMENMEYENETFKIAVNAPNYLAHYKDTRLLYNLYSKYYLDSNFLIAVESFMIIRILSDKYKLSSARKIINLELEDLEQTLNTNESKKTDKTVNHPKISTKDDIKSFLRKITTFALHKKKLDNPDNQLDQIDKVGRLMKYNRNRQNINNQDQFKNIAANDLKYTTQFFTRFINNVEFVDQSDSIQKVYYVLRPESMIITESEIEYFKRWADYTSDANKIKNFIYFFEEMYTKTIYFNSIYSNRLKLWLYNKVKYPVFDFVSLIFSAIINLILLLSYSHDFDHLERRGFVYTTLLVMGVLQILWNVSGMICYFYCRYDFNVQIAKCRFIEGYKLKIIDYLKIYIWKCWIASYDIYLLNFNFLIAVLGVSVPYLTFLYSLQFLSIIRFSKTVQNIFWAFQSRITQVIDMIVFMAIILYFFANIGFFYLSSEFDNIELESGKTDNLCRTMIQCYITHLKEGILSGGGIGDVIGQKKWKDDLGLFFSRWFLDMIFFIINILLVLNMINGIVVNAFADMREKDDVLNRESTEKCFICSIERSEFKKNNLSFSQHKAKDHNVMNYLNYLIKIRMTPDKDLDFFDEYIKKRIYLKDIKVFPNKETLSLGKEKS